MSRYYEINIKGKHWLHRVADKDTHTHNGEADESRLIYSEADKKVYLGDTSQWNLVTTPYDIFAQNTRVLMGKFPLPTGWNIVTSWNNNYSPIMTDTVGSIGTSGGSWTITGLQEGGSHNHGGRTGTSTSNVYIGASDVYTLAAIYNHRHNIGYDGEHFHNFSGNWRWANIKYCVAEYQ